MVSGVVGVWTIMNVPFAEASDILPPSSRQYYKSMKVFKPGINKRPHGIPEQQVYDDIICDSCNKSCWDCDKMNWENAEIKATWGFYSKKDGEQHESDLCEDCYDKMLETFKIKPKIFDYLGIGLPPTPEQIELMKKIFPLCKPDEPQ